MKYLRFILFVIPVLFYSCNALEGVGDGDSGGTSGATGGEESSLATGGSELLSDEKLKELIEASERYHGVIQDFTKNVSEVTPEELENLCATLVNIASNCSDFKKLCKDEEASGTGKEGFFSRLRNFFGSEEEKKSEAVFYNSENSFQEFQKESEIYLMFIYNIRNKKLTYDTSTGVDRLFETLDLISMKVLELNSILDKEKGTQPVKRKRSQMVVADGRNVLPGNVKDAPLSVKNQTSMDHLSTSTKWMKPFNFYDNCKSKSRSVFFPEELELESFEGNAELKASVHELFNNSSDDQLIYTYDPEESAGKYFIFFDIKEREFKNSFALIKGAEVLVDETRLLKDEQGRFYYYASLKLGGCKFYINRDYMELFRKKN